MKKLITLLLFVSCVFLSYTSYSQFQNVFDVPNQNIVYALESNDSHVFAGTGGSGIFRLTHQF